MIRQLVMIACAAYSLAGVAQGVDTICLPRTEVIAQINAHAACDSAVVVMGSLLGVRESRIAELEESRSELMMQVDLHKRVRSNIEAESDVLRAEVKAANRRTTIARMWLRLTIAAAVAVEATTVYLLVR